MSFGEGAIDGHKTVVGRKGVDQYFTNIKMQAHGSVFEHANYSYLVEGVSRSLTHELVRHRAGFAYSQLSQRYVEPDNIAFVVPPSIPLGTSEFEKWKNACESASTNYKALLDAIKINGGSTANKKKVREAARSVLPNSTETKIVVTANIRAWRHFLTMRGAVGADAEIRRLALAMLIQLKSEAPSIFSDLNEAIADDKTHFINVDYVGV